MTAVAAHRTVTVTAAAARPIAAGLLRGAGHREDAPDAGSEAVYGQWLLWRTRKFLP